MPGIEFLGDRPGFAILLGGHEGDGLSNEVAEAVACDLMTRDAGEVTRVLPDALVLDDRQPDDLEAIEAPALADEGDREGVWLQALERIFDLLVGSPEARLVLSNLPSAGDLVSLHGPGRLPLRPISNLRLHIEFPHGVQQDFVEVIRDTETLLIEEEPGSE